MDPHSTSPNSGSLSAPNGPGQCPTPPLESPKILSLNLGLHYPQCTLGLDTTQFFDNFCLVRDGSQSQSGIDGNNPTTRSLSGNSGEN